LLSPDAEFVFSAHVAVEDLQNLKAELLTTMYGFSTNYPCQISHCPMANSHGNQHVAPVFSAASADDRVQNLSLMCMLPFKNHASATLDLLMKPHYNCDERCVVQGTLYSSTLKRTYEGGMSFIKEEGVMSSTMLSSTPGGRRVTNSGTHVFFL